MSKYPFRWHTPQPASLRNTIFSTLPKDYETLPSFIKSSRHYRSICDQCGEFIKVDHLLYRSKILKSNPSKIFTKACVFYSQEEYSLEGAITQRLCSSCLDELTRANSPWRVGLRIRCDVCNQVITQNHCFSLQYIPVCLSCNSDLIKKYSSGLGLIEWEMNLCHQCMINAFGCNSKNTLGSRIICNVCGDVIERNYLFVLQYHPVCSDCHSLLIEESVSFNEKKLKREKLEFEAEDDWHWSGDVEWV